MDNPNTNNPPTPSSDLSFQVMPKENASSEYKQDAPAVARTVPESAGSTGSMLPQGHEPSFWTSKWFYIILAALVLIVLASLAYFFLGSKKTSQPEVQTVQTKLPKVWLQQYFSLNLNADGSCKALTICGDDADPDSDGLKNYDEFKAGTSPINPDTDADGLADGDEVNIYKTEPTLKFTDRRDIVAQNNWTDSFQIKGGYDPLTPSLKFTDARIKQISVDTATFALHEPSITSLSASANPVQPPTATPTPTPNPAPTTGLPQTLPLTIQNMAFSPSVVTIKKGDTIVWTNKDKVVHTVTGNNGGFSSSNIAVNGTYSFKFSTAGTFSYHCSIHPIMTGKIVVQ